MQPLYSSQRARPFVDAGARRLPARAALSCLLLLTSLLTGLGCKGRTTPNELLIFAAASTAAVMGDLSAQYETKSGTKARFSFAGSRELARQLRAGAQADVFVSADAESVEGLTRDGLVDPKSARPVASNRLVVIVPKDSDRTIAAASDLAKTKRFALGDPTNVPAGIYAKKWLEGAGAWEDAKEHVIPTLDVRAALAAVEAERADAAIVYATDAATSSQVRVAYEVPAAEAPTIVYVAAPIAGSPHPSAPLFVDFMASQEGRAAFLRRGFLAPESKR